MQYCGLAFGLLCLVIMLLPYTYLYLVPPHLTFYFTIKIVSTGRQRQVDLYESEANLVNRENPKTTRTTQRNWLRRKGKKKKIVWEFKP